MWKCPECERFFVRVDQQHRCEKGNEEDAIALCTDDVRDIYSLLKEYTRSMGDVLIEAHNNRITFLCERRFMEVTLLKTSINLGFVLCRKVDEFPIYDTYGYSKNRCGHLVKLESAEEIDEQLKRWIKESYETVGQQ